MKKKVPWQLVDFHRGHGCLGTVTAVQPPGRFGEIEVEGTQVREFNEKPLLSRGEINGGFFVFQRRFLDHLRDDPVRRHVVDAVSDRDVVAVSGQSPRRRGTDTAGSAGDDRDLLHASTLADMSPVAATTDRSRSTSIASPGAVVVEVTVPGLGRRRGGSRPQRCELAVVEPGRRR